MAIKTIITVFLIFWFSLTMMVISHEAWHIFQFSSQESGIDQVCFLGYRKGTTEVNNETRNLHIFGWTWANKPNINVTEWDAWLIGIDVMLMSGLTLMEVLILNGRNKDVSNNLQDKRNTLL